MARPKSKEELIKLSTENFKKLNDFIDGFSEAEKQAEFPEGTMNRNFRDVLAHLHHWHLMMLDWYKVGMTGNIPDMPAKGYSWRDVPQLNKQIWKQYQTTDLDEIRQLLNASFLSVQKIIQAHSHEVLFKKKYYAWTGTTSLGSYLISATSSHYDWALKLLKKIKKSSK